jgi:hypothetical protein
VKQTRLSISRNTRHCMEKAAIRLFSVLLIVSLLLGNFPMPAQKVSASSTARTTESFTQLSSTKASYSKQLTTTQSRPKLRNQISNATASKVSQEQAAPIEFVENVGQADSRAKFQVNGSNAFLNITEDGFWLTATQIDPNSISKFTWRSPDSLLGSQTPSSGSEQSLQSEPQVNGVNLHVTFEGANPAARIEGFDRLSSKVSYFRGNDPQKWRADVPVWGGIRYVDLYPGVDLVITSKNGELVQRLESTTIATLNTLRTNSTSDLQTDAIDQVKLKVEGGDSLMVDQKDILVNTSMDRFQSHYFKRAQKVRSVYKEIPLL